jgi:hypothetical protein
VLCRACAKEMQRVWDGALAPASKRPEAVAA